MIQVFHRGEEIWIAWRAIDAIRFRPDGSTIIEMPVCVYEIVDTSQEDIRQQMMAEVFPATHFRH